MQSVKVWSSGRFPHLLRKKPLSVYVLQSKKWVPDEVVSERGTPRDLIMIVTGLGEMRKKGNIILSL